MISYSTISDLPKEKMLEFLAIYAKDWLATDGLWFQSVESKYGMDEAMEHDVNVWQKLGVIEARRIKEFLDLPERPGISGLKQSLAFRLYSPINSDRIEISENQLTYYTEVCRVQSARSRKNMPLHPCKIVGITEFTAFAQTIDDRFTVECVSCYPDLIDTQNACVWRFTLAENDPDRS